MHNDSNEKKVEMDVGYPVNKYYMFEYGPRCRLVPHFLLFFLPFDL